MQPCIDMTTDRVKIVREPHILEKVVFVGGHPGCGKTMLTPIIGSFDRVEIQKFNYTIEHMCSLHLVGKMESDATSTMIRMLTDLDIYNMMMSRETNFRFKDLSSIFKNPGTWRYIRRLFAAGDEKTVERIKKERPILQITTHNLLAISPPLFEALGDRLRIIELVRHPLYMIKQWHVYVDLYGSDARDFTIWVDYKGQAVPFFAQGWEEKYVKSNSMDKVIYSIEHLMKLQEHVIQSLSESKKSQILVIPFEGFVLNPWPYLEKIEALLSTHITRRTLRELKRQKVPRKKIADGIGLSIYKKYGWRPSKKGTSEGEELSIRRDFAQKHASKEAMSVLDNLCAKYEMEHLNSAC